MLGRIGMALLWGAGCYVLAAAITFALISRFSRNTHDRSVEAAMTALGVVGPLGALLGCIVAFLAHRSG